MSGTDKARCAACERHWSSPETHGSVCPTCVHPSEDGERILTRSSSIVEAAASDEIQDSLVAQGVSDELVEHWANMEMRVFVESATKALGREMRAMCVGLMARNVACCQLQEKHWYEALVLLDMYCLRAPSPICVTDLPSLCGALVRLVRKIDNRMCSKINEGLLINGMNLAKWLKDAGHAPFLPEVTVTKFEHQEVEVLKVLKWNVSVPTLWSWMTVFCARLNTFTKGSWTIALSSVWQYVHYYARSLVGHFPNTRETQPRNIAQGLLCIGCVMVRLLPATTLGLDAIELPPMPAPVTPPNRSPQAVLELLQVATRSDWQCLNKDCQLVSNQIIELTGAPHSSAF